MHRQLAAPDIWRLLSVSGYSRIRAAVGQDREQRAPGTRQAIRDSAGANIHVPGDRNRISVHIGPHRAVSKARGLLYGLVVTLVAVAATVVYLVTRDPGVPDYYQTGPTAGIYVPPSTPDCENITPDALISPAENVLTNVSEAHALSLNGRSAILMNGTFNGGTYEWITSDPDGIYGGMRLQWWVDNGKSRYCTVTLPGGSPAALARQGERQVSSMAVPTAMNGKSVMFQVCVWYTVRKQVKSRCWP
jgi:hypothetical protein